MTRRYWNIKLGEMMDAGVLLGHRPNQANPKMAPYIAGQHTTRRRKRIHFINIFKTARFLSEACEMLFNAAKEIKEEETASKASKVLLNNEEETQFVNEFLIVGTQKRVADSVLRAAISAQCHYVNKKWFSGMLTNWSTTETRLHNFRDLRMIKKRGILRRLPKRDAAILKRQLSHLQRSLGGIKYMRKLPDFVIIIDQQKDYTALRECIKLGIPTISLIDTNSDPDLADMSIPANDDSRSSIEFILNKLVFAILRGRYVSKRKRTEKKRTEKKRTY